MNGRLYSRVLIPETSIEKDPETSIYEIGHPFPGRKIQLGGKILPLENHLHSGKSLNFYKGNRLKLYKYTVEERYYNDVNNNHNHFALQTH